MMVLCLDLETPTEKGYHGVSRGNRAEHANYGVDAPRAVRNAALAGSTCGLLAPLAYILLLPRRQALARRMLALGAFAALSSLIFVGGMLWSSRVGKLRACDRLIGSVPWRGDERVLDVGCGRGLLLIVAAKRLTTGKAVGVDIWDAADQSGNRPEATLQNARLEGVAKRADIMNADAHRLPFANETFDVVLSSLVLHNIHAPPERKEALREMVRVLKGGGYLAILDVLHTGQYVRVLRKGGAMSGVERTEPRFLFFFPSRAVFGRKAKHRGA